MKKLLLLFFIFSLNSALAQEQKLAAIPMSEQFINADSFIGFDALGAYYLIKDNVISKHFDGKILEYKNVSLGKITKVDLQNPLKIVLLYENFNSVVILDNQLNEVHTINFSDNEIPIMATAIGIASQNRLWIYNNLSQQIGLFDFQKNTYQSITPSFQANFKHYESDFNSFQWIDYNLNWYSCDVFGKVTSLGKVADFDQIQSVPNKGVVFYKDGKLFLHDFQKNVIYTIVNIEKTLKNFYYKDQILSIFTTTGIINYKITIP